MKWVGNMPALSSGALNFAVALALPLAIAAPLGLAPLLLATAFAILIGEGLPYRVHRRFAIATAILAAVVIWGALSAIWSINPSRSFSMAGRLALTFVASGLLLEKALRLDLRGRRNLITALALGAGLGVILLITEATSGQALLQFGRSLLGARDATPVMMNRAATVVALMIWPTAYALYRMGGTVTALSFLVAAFGAVALQENTTALLACLLGLGVGLIAMALPKITRRAVVAMTVAGILAAPLGVSILAGQQKLHMLIKPSAVHRLMIWQFTVDRIDERPVLGWGLETARDLPGGDKDITFMTREGEWTRQALPLHTHNAALQLRVELGILASALFAGLIFGIGLAVGRVESRIAHAARLAMLVSVLAISMASYGVWQFWWLAAIGIAIAAMVGVGLPEPEETDTSKT